MYETDNAFTLGNLLHNITGAVTHVWQQGDGVADFGAGMSWKVHIFSSGSGSGRSGAELLGQRRLPEP